MDCQFTGCPCRYISCGLWDEQLQVCRFVLAVNKMLTGNGGVPRLAHLTPMEMDTLQLLCEGHSNKEIAEVVSCSPQTVKNRITSILWKVGAKNRTEAVSIALKTGIVPLKQQGS